MLYIRILNESSDTGSITVRHPQSGPGGASYEPRSVITPSLSILPLHTKVLSLMCHESIQVQLTSSLLLSHPSNSRPSCGFSPSAHLYAIVMNFPSAASETVTVDSYFDSAGVVHG